MGVSTSMKPRASSCRRSDEMTLRARDEYLAHVGIGDQVEIALPVARLHVLQAVPLLGHGEQRLGEELELLDVHAQLAGARAEQVAFHADDVADIEQLEELEIALADRVLLDVDLQALAVLLQVRESRLAHVAQRHQRARRCARASRATSSSAGLRAVFRQNLRDRVGELESPAVRAVAQASISLMRARRCFNSSSSSDKSVSIWGKYSYYKSSFETIHLHYHSCVQRRETASGDAAKIEALPRTTPVGFRRDRRGE